jgi:phenylacetate-coenzyme A ligase PaaK-like adenylate-forming protein
MKKTPLEGWIQKRMLPHHARTLTPEVLQEYQLRKLREVVSYVRQESPFYRTLYSDLDERSPDSLSAFARLPFTTPRDLREQGGRMLCTSQDEIERVVTLQTSGTTGEAKRIFFTRDDLESTVDFFSHGMSTMVESGGTVIIFLPGERPDSVGDLLSRSLARIGVTSVVWGPVRDAAAARAEVLRHRSPCLVGIPTQIFSLARGDVEGIIPRGWVDSVLLSTDYVSTAIEQELENLWDCRVFTHYGMTETGLGGGVECAAGRGYHLREADLYTEIIDPITGRPVAEGKEGEVVFTTLTRRGMPLVRYRTGDRARMLPGACPCGTVLKRLGRVHGRIEAEIVLRSGSRLSMPALDEALFPIPEVLSFTAKVTGDAAQAQLHICFQVNEGAEEGVAYKAGPALLCAEQLAGPFQEGELTLGSITFSDVERFTTGVGKRRIADLRSRPFCGTEAKQGYQLK